MSDRECQLCGKHFKYPRDLRKHQQSKRTCIPILAKGELPLDEQLRCRFCGREFTEASSRDRHVRMACKIVPNDKNGDKGMERLYEHMIRKQSAEIADLKAQNVEILALLRQGAPTATSMLQAGEVAIQAGDNAQVDNSKKIININVFGQEKLDHVTAERIRSILDECLQRPAQFFGWGLRWGNRGGGSSVRGSVAGASVGETAGGR